MIREDFQEPSLQLNNTLSVLSNHKTHVFPLHSFKSGSTFIHLNTQSLLPKLDEFRVYLSNPKICVLSLNENWLNDTVTNDEVSVPGFTIFRKDRTHGTHGGVTLYVRNDLNPEIVSDLSSSCI